MQADNRFCRNCPHHRDGHLSSLEDRYLSNRVCFGEDRVIRNNRYFVEFCSCHQYVPKDNLEYLEWCVENKRSQYETAKR
jgi:hypothetical protein